MARKRRRKRKVKDLGQYMMFQCYRLFPVFGFPAVKIKSRANKSFEDEEKLMLEVERDVANGAPKFRRILREVLRLEGYFQAAYTKLPESEEELKEVFINGMKYEAASALFFLYGKYARWVLSQIFTEEEMRVLLLPTRRDAFVWAKYDPDFANILNVSRATDVSLTLDRDVWGRFKHKYEVVMRKAEEKLWTPEKLSTAFLLLFILEETMGVHQREDPLGLQSASIVHHVLSRQGRSVEVVERWLREYLRSGEG